MINRYLKIFFIFLAIFKQKNIPIISAKNIDIKEIFSHMRDTQIRKILDIIAICEGTARNKNHIHKPSLKEYQVSFGYTEKIKNLEEFPYLLYCPKINEKRVCGTASGRYQFILKTWENISKKINQKKIAQEHPEFFDHLYEELPKYYDKDIVNLYKSREDIFKHKFGPIWQDISAIYLLMKANVIEDIKNKNIENILDKISFIWPSFPKNYHSQNRYSDGVNHAKKYAFILKLFKKHNIWGNYNE